MAKSDSHNININYNTVLAFQVISRKTLLALDEWKYPSFKNMSEFAKFPGAIWHFDTVFQASFILKKDVN